MLWTWFGQCVRREKGRNLVREFHSGCPGMCKTCFPVEKLDHFSHDLILSSSAHSFRAKTCKGL